MEYELSFGKNENIVSAVRGGGSQGEILQSLWLWVWGVWNLE
jgi:hypothetical protein